jgi:arsenate reductase-like glutaredoxin family protein
MSQETQTINPAEMTAEQLRELLAQKEQEETKARKEREKAYKKSRDEFVKLTVVSMMNISNEMALLKREVVERGNKLHSDMYEIFGKTEKELKSFSIITECGQFKITIERQDRMALDETAEVAVSTIKEVFREKFAKRSKTMFRVLEEILMKNKKGDYDERLVAKLRKHEDELQDPRFSEALDQLAKAYQVTSTATYVRAYKFNEKTNGWDDIPMQWSNM